VARPTAGGKLVLALEGGYSYEGLAESIEAVTRVLLEDPPTDAERAGRRPAIRDSPQGGELARYVRRAQRDYWKTLQ
jgi:hypothetical protein